MHKIILSILIIVFTCSFIMIDAQAKRFGGGKSFGFSRPARGFSNPISNGSRASAMSRTSGMSKWLAPLAGFALGGLLASLFMGHGLGAGIMSWVLMAGALFLIWQVINKFKQSNRPPVTSATMPNFYQQNRPEVSSVNSSSYNNFQEVSAENNTQFVGFDVPTFLRQAKTIFIRLQAAYDSKNLADIREFTTPEVFAEIQMQLHERDNAVLNQTEVVSIEAELIDHNADGQGLTASVSFSGLIREQAGLPAGPIKEIWHFIREKNSLQWLVAGIQQTLIDA